MADKERVEKFKQLCEEYKKQKEEERWKHPENFTPQEPYELFGIECGDGWKDLYQPLIDYINKFNEDKENEEQIHILQIKEKFGGLRFYVDKYTEELRDMIRAAESKSYNTCEVCGKWIEKPIIKNHWIYTECQECHDKLEEEKQKKIHKLIIENIHKTHPKIIKE